MSTLPTVNEMLGHALEELNQARNAMWRPGTGSSPTPARWAPGVPRPSVGPWTRSLRWPARSRHRRRERRHLGRPGQRAGHPARRLGRGLSSPRVNPERRNAMSETEPVYWQFCRDGDDITNQPLYAEQDADEVR